MSEWRLIPLGEPTDPLWNMACDETLLRSGKNALPTLRFYQWCEPAVSIGYFQNVSSVADALPPSDAGRSVVRRITGGGRVRHGRDLTVSLVLPVHNHLFSAKASESYGDIHRIYFEALKLRYPDLRWVSAKGSFSPRSHVDCFQEAVCSDIEWRGKKILGSSQRRSGGTFLHQTSILLEEDARLLTKLIGERFAEHCGVSFRMLPVTDDEKSEIRALIRDKYSRIDFSFIPKKVSLSAVRV